MMAAASLAVIVAASGAVWHFGNPLHRSENGILSWATRQAPMGTPVDAFLGLAQDRGWEIRQDWQEDATDYSREHYPGVEGNRIVHTYLVRIPLIVIAQSGDRDHASDRS